MTNKHDANDEREFSAAARRLFDESVDNLDAATLSRLNRGRQAALAEAATGPKRWLQWAPAGGLAAATALAFVLWSGNSQIAEFEPPAAVSDMEILLTEDSLEMIEDLEFYSWMEFEVETSSSQIPTSNVG